MLYSIYMFGEDMYFPAKVYTYAIEDYAFKMKRNPSSVRSYMARNPEWALEVACVFMDRYSGISESKYPEMKQQKKGSPKAP